MTGTIRLNSWLVIAAAVVLIGTAAFHATGYRPISDAIQASNAKPFLVVAVKALWLMLSAHLVILAAVVVLANGAPGGRRVLLACALIPAFDTVLLASFVGAFIGTFSLAAAAVLLIAGALLRTMPASAGGT